jgi:hypothetical protein
MAYTLAMQAQIRARARNRNRISRLIMRIPNQDDPPVMPFGMIYRNRGEVPLNAGKGTESDYD